MHLQFLNTLMPIESRFRGVELPALVALSVLAILITLFLPAKFVLSFIVALVLLYLATFTRTHMIQILVLTIIISFSFSSGISDVFKLIFYLLFAWALFFSFAKGCLISDLTFKISSHHIVAGILFSLGCLALISLIINSRFYSKSIFEVVRLFSFTLLFLVIYYYLHTIKAIKKIIITIIIVSLVYSLYSYWLIFNMGFTSLLIMGATALRGIETGLGNSNSVAAVVSYSIPFIISYILFSKERRKNIIRVFALIFIIISCLLWNSRATYVNILVSLLVIIGFHKKRLRYYMIIGCLVVIGIVIAYYVPLFEQLLRLDRGLSHRDHLWQAAIRIFLDNPFLGLGPDSYWRENYYFMDPSYARSSLGGGGPITAHNLLLSRAAELGIGAPIIILSYWIFVITFFIKNENTLRYSDCYYIYIGCGAMFIGMIFKMFFEGSGNVFPLLLAAIIFKLPQLQKIKTNS